MNTVAANAAYTSAQDPSTKTTSVSRVAIASQTFFIALRHRRTKLSNTSHKLIPHVHLIAYRTHGVSYPSSR
ncbi:hypothetical protein G7K_2682-t1 [Saitoella complicata NRRL Y-17804]|uniref:Uncharacterized protein n=1 Tax=Saitoella complicata (strain BCRC 22490 / CBS 7301 / JCM 7358 / NBRC 10748 / NRRL Y-17804) TaxID=698492 RepID=A0A0E9NF93_SAICN|nr:hypothetical protein G7K_2682-t1 [Saitoella complicata NRRL Y-17804]